MEEQTDFKSLIARVRAGDASAAQELVETYEADLRVVARSRLRDSRMRRTLDSLDVCQSVLGAFFVRAASGQLEVDTPEQLLRLLATMARNKVTDLTRHARADKRDAARIAATPADELAVRSQGETPSQVLVAKELLDKARSALPEDVRRISDLRRNGVAWDEIGRILDESPEALRKKLKRSMDHVCDKLGIGDAVD